MEFAADIRAVLPETILVVTILAAIIMDVLSGWRAKSVTVVSIGGLALAGVAAISTFGTGGSTFAGTVYTDGYASLFKLVFAVIGILTILFSPYYLKEHRLRLGEYYSLLLCSVFGMMVMVSAANLLLFFLGLEIMSIALYVLASLQRKQIGSVESGLKYLVLGAFSSGFLLYGIALMYGIVGSMDYADIAGFFASDFRGGPMIYASIALLLTGFAFKIAAVPFHFWSPDVYEGAPTTITGFMSTGPKAAAFIALIRLFGVVLHPTAPTWTEALTWVAMLTMTVGNVVALKQSNLKRMLAYSSIAHAGYLLVGIIAGTKAAFAATGYYLVSYAFMNLGAFAVIILLDKRSKSTYSWDNLRGMGFEHPLLGMAMTVFMLSLTGIPPTAGFFGKLYVFSAAIEQERYLLAIVGVLNSAVAAYYYLRIIVTLYMTRPEGDLPAIDKPASYQVALVLSMVVILVIGIAPEPLLSLLTSSVP